MRDCWNGYRERGKSCGEREGAADGSEVGDERLPSQGQADKDDDWAHKANRRLFSVYPTTSWTDTSDITDAGMAS